MESVGYSHRVRPTTRRPSLAGRSWGRRVAGAAILGGAAFLLSGCTLPTFGVHPGATSQAHDTTQLWEGFTIGAIAVGGITFVLILFAALRYRARKGDGSLPRQSQYHLPMEITYTVIPIIIVLILFGFTVGVEDVVTSLPKPQVTIKVQAFQWGWRFFYPDFVISGQTTGEPTMTIPEGETVRVDLTSLDVIHAFYVPNFNFGRQAIPGINNEFTFNATKQGSCTNRGINGAEGICNTYFGQCVQLCGLYHGLMWFRVQVVTPTYYDDTYLPWGRAHQAELDAAAGLGGRQQLQTGVPVRPYLGGGTN